MKKEFDIAVIGGGVGGLVTASGASRFGANVALVEKESLGGDCLHYGCVPTKALIKAAKAVHMARNLSKFGIDPVDCRFEFKKVMDRVRAVQAEVGKADSPDRFTGMGVKLFFGDGEFQDNHIFKMADGSIIKSKKFVMATGSRPVTLPIEGLDKVDYRNNISMLNMDKLPESLLIIGAGPIGMEFGQAFCRLGSKVTVIEKAGVILSKEDPELTSLLRAGLEKEGMNILTCIDIKNIGQSGSKKIVYASCSGVDKEFKADELFVAIGRAPNIEGLGLDRAGVQTKRSGVIVDSTMKTTAPNIWACGDVTGLYPFTHMAEYEAGLIIGNALFPLPKRKMDENAIPWTTFTDPELARSGLTEDEARRKYSNVKVYRYSFENFDRAIIEGQTNGIVKLVCSDKGMILGAHILGPGAGELLPEYVLAMKHNIPVYKIARTVHAYPTMGQVTKRGADQYYAERLFTGWISKLAKLMIRL